MIAVGSMVWRHVAFVHWRVPPRVVAPLLPPGLEVDTLRGDAFVGLLPFAIHDARPRLLPPLPGASDFPEFNLRTYVRRGDTPGIWFFSLDAASGLAVVGARLGYGLPYFRAEMSVDVEGDSVRYRSRRTWPGPHGAGLSATCTVGGAIGVAREGTLEHFLVERYVLFARRGGRLLRGDVRHPPYALRAAEVAVEREGLREAAGLPTVGERLPDYYCAELAVDVGAPVVLASEPRWVEGGVRPAAAPVG